MNINIKYEKFGSHSGDAQNSSILRFDSLVGSFWCYKGLYYLQNCVLLGY
jgi:hypothetical protein